MDGATRNLESDNVSALAAAFPEVVADGKVDFEKLRLILGADIDDSEERYSFNWPGKRDAIKMAISRTTGTLRPDKENSKDWDTTQNMFIEGDNLEVLRSLQNSYRGKIKMIYIDPPYNTGKDFVYKDDFKDNIRNYKENASLEGQSNPDTAGRYHTNWLNMMYPRLRLAKNLLTDDGALFISIDDHEAHNLRKICDEIFGEDNYLGDFVWQKQGNDNKSIFSGVKTFRNDHDSVVVYARKREIVEFDRPEEDAEFQNDYGNADDDSRGDWMSAEFGKSENASLPNGKNYYTITTPNGTEYTRQWHHSEDELENLITDNRVYFGKTGGSVPRLKKFLADKVKKVPSSLLTKYGSTKIGQSELDELFEGKRYFDYPKPKDLIKLFAMLSTDKSSIVLDFFAGSATSAQATIDLNVEDGGNRRFIMVQIPESTPESSEAREAGYNIISEISRKRIDLAGEKIKEDYKDKLAERETPLDVGFKAFTLDTTNFREWDTNTTNIEQSLLDALDTFKEGRNEEDALYEVLLKYGVDITEPVEVLTLAGSQVYSLAGNYLLVCLEKSITLETIEAMAALKPERVVCYDDGFADEDVKQNSLETLKRAGVTDVRVV